MLFPKTLAHSMNKVFTTLIVIGFTAQIAQATILFRSTWEDPAIDPPITWTINQSGSAFIERVQKNIPPFPKNAKQAHGVWSCWIKDPGTPSYATAISQTFTDTASEYLIEFYVFNPNVMGFVSLFNNFPVCLPVWNAGPPGVEYRTDIGVYLSDSLVSPNMYKPSIYVEDNFGIHHVGVILDSTGFWYRFQIHHKPNNTDDFYFKGNLIGTYQPLNSSYKTTAIRMGPDAAHASAHGEAYLDDYIVTTVPNGSHPRLFYSENDRTNLNNRIVDDNTQPFGYSFAQVWGKLRDSANYWITPPPNGGRDFECSNCLGWITYPYAQPQPMGDGCWTMLFNTDLHRRFEEVGFAYWLTQDQSYITYCHDVLHSIFNWERWQDPADTYQDANICLPENLYMSSSGPCLIMMMARLYDDAFGALSNYEKMSYQNSLITLGLQEAYLEMMKFPAPGWGNPAGNCGALITGGCGFGALVLDDPTLRAQYVSGATIKCDSLFNNQYFRPPQPGQPGPVIADTMGAINYQCIGYDPYGFLPILYFAVALKNVLGNDHFLNGNSNVTNHGDWLLYTMQGWDHGYAPSYGDVYGHYRENYRYLALLAAYFRKPEIQWLFTRNFQLHQIYNYGEYINRDAFLISPLVTYDPSIPAQPPTNFPVGGRFHDAWVAFRGGWGDSAATLLMKSGPSWGHAHRDCNSIEFSYGPSYFIDEYLGYMSQNKYDTYYHNTIMVDAVSTDDQYGQTRGSSCLDAPSSVVEKFYSDQYYGFACSEAGPLYNANRLKTFKRKLLFTLDGHFVLKDEIKSNSGEQHQYYSLNWDYGQGTITGTNDTLGITSIEPLRKCRVNVLLPSNRQVYSSGQPAYIQTPASTQTTDSTQFLLTYFPYHGNETLPAITLFQTNIPSVGDPMIGARVTGGRVGDELFLFNRNQGTIVLNTVYQLTASGTVTNYVTDLLPNATYQAINRNLVTGVLTVASIQTTNGGTAKFDTPVNGQQREITLRYQILINGGGKFTNNQNVTVQPSATSFAYQMMVRDSGGTWGSWQNFSTSFPWTLPAGDGFKEIQIELKDVNGNVSGIGVGSIILDQTLPVAQITSPAHGATVSGTVTISGKAYDPGINHFWVDTLRYFRSSSQHDTIHVSWQPIGGKNQTGLLGNWNTTLVTNGWTRDTLAVYDSAGNVAKDSISLNVYNNSTTGGATWFASGFGTYPSLTMNVATDPNGDLYIAETQNSKVRKFSPIKDSLFAFSTMRGRDSTGSSWATAMIVKDSTTIWIADGYNHCIKKFDSQGNLLLRFGSFGQDTGKFRQPCGLALDSKSRLWVVDRLNNRIQVFDTTGHFIFKFGSQGLDSGKFNSPTGIAYVQKDTSLGLTQDLVYISDTRNNQIQVFDSIGNHLKTIKQVDSLGLDTPFGLSSDKWGDVFIADSRHNRIVELNPFGQRILDFGGQGDSLGLFRTPVGVASSPGAHYLYVADMGNKRVQRFWVIQGDTLGGGGGPQSNGWVRQPPNVYFLNQAYPNPSTGEAMIEYGLPRESEVRLVIYNVAGQIVREYNLGKQKAWHYSIKWNGKTNHGHPVGAGVYFYRLNADNWAETKKMVVIR